MSQDDIRNKLEAAADYLTVNPGEARYTDSPATARLLDPGGLATQVSGPNGEQLASDMPASVGGGDSAPSPGWFLRAAEASCVATLIAMRAARLQLPLKELIVSVDSESDDRGILGLDESIPAGPLSTRIAVHIDAPSATASQKEDLVGWAVEHCPVTDAVGRAVPLRIEIS